MDQVRVISREYKVVLKAENFTGNEAAVMEKAQLFWTEFKQAIHPSIKVTIGNLDRIKTSRAIRFYDTADFALYGQDYIFRERKNIPDGKREVTLKFRHPDRYVSQDRDMKPRINKADIKFEEDIKAPFVKLYSFSASGSINDEAELKKLEHIVKLYPGLERELDHYWEDEQLLLVHDRVIQEIVITGSEIKIGIDPLISAECALIVWYGAEAFVTDPIIVEFSFRYGHKKEGYPGTIAQSAYDLFILMQERMKSWLAVNDETKTGFVFND